MALARRVFSDLTNTAEESIRSTLKADDASKLQAPRSPAYTTDTDFQVLEDTPYQPKGDKHIDLCDIEADKLLPGFQTPQKLPLLPEPQKPLEHDAGHIRDLHDLLGKRGDDTGPESVARCAAELRDLWEHSVKTAGGRRIMCLLQKFGSMGPPRLAAVFFSPPMTTPPPPDANSWPQGRRTTQTAEHGYPSGDAETTQQPLPTVEQTLADRKLLDNDIERRADFAVQGLVSDILQSCHSQSERRMPDSEAILKNFPAEEREKTLMWLFQVCATVNFQDSVLHMAVQLLDRYCAALAAPILLDRLQLVTVAILSIALKMNGAVDENSKPPKLQDLLVHLTQQRFTIQDIFMAEHEVLRFLGFAVSMPTAVDLLDTFLMPHGLSESPDMASPVQCLAQFLLQLSLLDAPLHYRYSHAVLAAGSVYVALWCTQRGPEHVLALLEDVAVCFENDTQAPQLC